MSTVMSQHAPALPDTRESAPTASRESSAATAAAGPSPLRRFGLTMLIAAALPLAFGLLAPVEHALFDGPALGDAPLVNAMLVLALPHYGIALLFMLTSRRHRDVASRASIGAAFVLGLVLCGCLYLASRQHGLPEGAILLVGFYFMIHIYQDEWQFYRRDRGDRVAVDGVTVALLTTALMGSICGVAWIRATLIGDPVHNLRGAFDSHLIGAIDPTLLSLTGSLVFIALVAVCVRVAARRSRATVRSLVWREKTLWMIFWLIPHIYIASVLLHGKSEPVVLIHAVAWWLFTTSALARDGRAPRNLDVWSRLRTTQAGFQWLHGALVGVAFVTLMVARHHGPAAHEPQIDWVRNAFYYSSVMHITLSMFPPWFRRLVGDRQTAPRATPACDAAAGA